MAAVMTGPAPVQRHAQPWPQPRKESAALRIVDESAPACQPATAPQTTLASGALNLRELRHEVGNALAPAAGYAQLLLRRLSPSTDESDRYALMIIMESVTRATRLLDAATGGGTAAAPAGGSNLGTLARRAVDAIDDEGKYGGTVDA